MARIKACHPGVTISDAVPPSILLDQLCSLAKTKNSSFQKKISEMAGTIVVPGSRLCVADNQHCAGPGTYM